MIFFRALLQEPWKFSGTCLGLVNEISSGQKSGHSPDQENRISFAMAVTMDFNVGPFNSLSGPGNFGRHMCQQTHQSVSRRKIPYPLPDRLKALHNQYECGHAFPDHLVPVHDPDLRCRHGNPFNDANTVASHWIAYEHPTIYKASTSITTPTRKVYYRPSCGRCSCKQEYDGQEDLLFNLDNKHLIYYDFLFSYLHSMVEGRNPLIAYLKACERNHIVQSHTRPIGIKKLRQAWNAFGRLLDINPHQMPMSTVWSRTSSCHL